MKKHMNICSITSKVGQVIISLATFIIFIYFMKVINWNIGISFSFVPEIKEIAEVFMESMSQIDFYKNLIISIGRVYSGFGCAVLAAVPLAILIVESMRIKYLLYPIIEMIRPIPNVAWVPLSIVLFKTIGGSVLFITFIGAFFPILISTIEGLENVKQNYLKIAKSFRVKRSEYILGVKLPAASAGIYTGMLVGMSGSWLGVVVAEMISGQSGIGYLTWVNYTLVNMSGVIVCMIFIGGLGAISSCLIRIAYKMMHLEERKRV